MEGRANDVAFPPGTVRLEQLLDHKHAEIILNPVPTSDPNDPLNWPKWWKTVNFSLACLYTLLVFVNVDIGTVVWGELNADLGISFAALSNSFGINTAALAVGCVLFIPFALKFGRRPIYLFSTLVSTLTALWQAKMRNTGDLYGSMILSGLAGSIAETICQMTIADLFFVHQRGTANGVYLLMVNVGAFLGPVAAGYSAAAQGWRWIFWWTTIIGAACFLLFVFLYEETKYDPVLQSERIPSLQTEVFATAHGGRKSEDVSAIELGPTQSYTSVIDHTIPRKSYWQRMAPVSNTTSGWSTFLKHVYQPFIILCTFPAVSYTALIYGSLLAWFSVVVNVYSVFFTLPPYSFGPSGIGLLNLPPFIGGILGSLYGGLLNDWAITRLSRRNNGIFEPEMRLWVAVPTIVILPGSLLLFGLSTAHGMPWIVPCIGLGIFGWAFVTLGDVALTYCMDCYTDIIGDALVGVCFIRNTFATIIATTITPWVAGMGLQNTFIMCAVLSLVLTLTTVPMMTFGKRARIWTTERLKVMTERQFSSRG